MASHAQQDAAERKFFEAASRHQDVSVRIAIFTPGWGVDEDGNYWVQTSNGKWHVFSSAGIPENIRRAFTNLLS